MSIKNYHHGDLKKQMILKWVDLSFNKDKDFEKFKEKKYIHD